MPLRQNKQIRNARGKPDYTLIILTLVMVLFGLIMIYTISPVVSRNYFGDEGSRNFFFLNQLRNLGIGLFFFAVVSKINYQRLKTYALPIAAGALIFSFAVFVPGLSFTAYGATRWVNLGFITVQPSEVLKLALIIYMAVWFANLGSKVKSFKEGAKPFTILLVTVSFLVAVLQRDLGTMLVIFMVMAAMYFVAGAAVKHFTTILGGALAGVIGLIVMFPHRLSRITSFTNPEADPQGAGYHIAQVLIAIGSGGLFGRGIGKSVQLYGYVPAPPTDSIFAIVAEEFGLLGAVTILTLFLVIAYRGYRIALNAPDSFGRLLAVGIVALIITQALLNIAAMLSLVPLTGVPLPFISYGGTSLVITMISVAILLNISRYSKEKSHANRPLGRRYGGSYLSALGRSR